MDKFLTPAASKPSPPAPGAANGSTSGSLVRKRPLVVKPAASATPQQHPAQKKKHKPSDLDRLLGNESRGRKTGLSSALKQGLLGKPSSRQRQAGASLLQRRLAEDSSTKAKERLAPAASKPRSLTEKIKAKRPLAAAALAAAEKAGWHEIPSVRASAAPAPACLLYTSPSPRD